MALTHWVRITDDQGSSFKIRVTSPFIWPSDGTYMIGEWGACDYSYIVHTGGPVTCKNSDPVTKDAYLSINEAVPGPDWGIRLDGWQTMQVAWTVNSQGKGIAVQSWCLQLDPGIITWELED